MGLILKKALVIIPTTGAPEVATAIKSVLTQTYKDVDVLLVVDGSQFTGRTDETLREAGLLTGNRILRIDLPFNTGGGGFYGHRIMAAFGHLVNHDYVLFLDQDNIYSTNHVESLINEIDKYKFDWAYSLRAIVDKDGKFITDDNCESLGRWPVWVDDNAFLIDTSSYCFKTEFFRQVCHIWDHGWGADRRFYTIIKEHLKHNNYGCTGLHTLQYRLGGNDGSVTAEFFTTGNGKTNAKYLHGDTGTANGGQFPWHRRPV